VLQTSGFFENISAFRTDFQEASISSNFGAVPITGGPGQFLSSFRHSRINLHAGAPLGNAAFVGYLESDFLNAPDRQPFRLRQYFGEFRQGGWRVLAGQAWSLLRPNRRGTASDRNLMNTEVPDPGYHVGLVGVRRRQLRVTREIGEWQAVLAYEAGQGGAATTKIVRDSDAWHVELGGMAGANRRYALDLAAQVRVTSAVNYVGQAYWSQGGGPEALGTMPPRVHAHSTIHGFEANLPQDFELFGYGGIVYGTRSMGNRVVRQWTMGFARDVFKGSEYGRATIAAQFSSLRRALWTGPSGTTSFVLFSIRYSIPGL
jgi:hypothetical protein